MLNQKRGWFNNDRCLNICDYEKKRKYVSFKPPFDYPA